MSMRNLCLEFLWLNQAKERGSRQGKRAGKGEREQGKAAKQTGKRAGKVCSYRCTI